MQNRQFRWLLTFFLGVVVVALMGRGALQYAGSGFDFQWDATHLLLNGQNPYTATEQGVVLHHPLQPLSALYFPSALLLLTPYALLPYEVARWAWLLSTLAATVGSAVLLFPVFLGRRGMVHEVLGMVALLVLSTPWAIGIGIGQHAMLSLCFYLLAVGFATRHRLIWAGLALAVAAFKYVLIAPLALYFVYKKWYRALGVAALVHVVLHGVAAVRLGLSPVELLLQPLRLSSVTHANGGYIDFLALQRMSAALLAPDAVPTVAWMVASVLVAIVLLVIALTLPPAREQQLLMLLCWTGVLLFYHPVYDWVVLLIPLFLLLYQGTSFSRFGRVWMLAGIGAVFYLSRVTTLAIHLLPPNTATWLARGVLGLMVLLYYSVALTLILRALPMGRSAPSSVVSP